MAAFQGCLVKKSADLTGQNFTSGADLTWNTESYDHGGWHEGVTHPERLTVLAGVSRVRLLGQVRFGNLATSPDQQYTIEIKKNGSSLSPQVICVDDDPITNPAKQVGSAAISVVPGDYFTLNVKTLTDASADIVAISSWFAIEEVREPKPVSQFSGALVRKASNQTTANYSAGAMVAWDSEDYDVGGWHDNSSNPSRLTVPSGVSKVRLSGAIIASLTTGSEWNSINIFKNGSAIATGCLTAGADTTTVDEATIFSPVLDVSAGDYFELRYQTQSDSSVTVSTLSWFAIEKVE